MKYPDFPTEREPWCRSLLKASQKVFLHTRPIYGAIVEQCCTHLYTRSCRL